MKKGFVIFAILLVLLACGGGSSVSPTASPTRAWYQGGTLHDSTVAQWNAATNANRLATSADWVTALVGWDTLEEAREKAEELKTCVNETAKVSPPEMRITDLVGACAVLMGW